MMRTVTFILLMALLTVMDILYTYTNVKILKKHKAHWSETEYNPLVRASWHIFGLFKGTVLAGAGTVLAMLAIACIIGENEFFQGLLIGVYLMIHHVHYVNYAYISKKYLKKEPGFLTRIITEW